MPRFRVIYEVEAKDAAEARIAVQIGVERYMLDPDKFQKVRGKNTGRSVKPKPMVKMKQVCDCNPTADYTCSMCRERNRIDDIALEA